MNRAHQSVALVVGFVPDPATRLGDEARARDICHKLNSRIIAVIVNGQRTCGQAGLAILGVTRPGDGGSARAREPPSWRASARLVAALHEVAVWPGCQLLPTRCRPAQIGAAAWTGAWTAVTMTSLRRTFGGSLRDARWGGCQHEQSTQPV